MRMKLLPAILLASLTAIVGASEGDEAPEYLHCVELCIKEHRITPSGTVLSLAQRLTRWTRTDDCKYNCMHTLADEATRQGNPVLRYRRKWPLWRVGGMQEPASVAFSLLNLLTHAQGAQKIRRVVPKNHPMRSHYLFCAIASMNAWVWTSVYHTRDFPITEFLRYFSIGLANLYTCYYTAVRLFLHPPLSGGRLIRLPETLKRKVTPLFWITVVTVASLYSILCPTFDYSHRIVSFYMFFDAILSVAHGVLWLHLAGGMSYFGRMPSHPESNGQEPSSLAVLSQLILGVTVHSYSPGFVSLAWYLHQRMTFVTTLEIFEFTPWGRLIDVHVLWGLLAFMATRKWYNLLIADSLDPGWRGPNSIRRRRDHSPDRPTKQMRKTV